MLVVLVEGKNEAEAPSLSDIDVDAVVNLVQPLRPSGEDSKPSQGAASRTSREENSSRLPEKHSGRVLLMPPPRKAPYQFILLQQWEGTVTNIGETEFTAELRDITDPTRPREEAVLDIEETSPGDLRLWREKDGLPHPVRVVALSPSHATLTLALPRFPKAVTLPAMQDLGRLKHRTAHLYCTPESLAAGLPPWSAPYGRWLVGTGRWKAPLAK